jgi:trehalose 6-phosphate phosphatase
MPPVDLLRGASLFLDFDGTLVEIVERPDAVQVDAALTMLMARLADKLQGRLAIISGRPRAEIDALFGDRRFAVGGSHGLELRWSDGRLDAPPPHPGFAPVIAEMRLLAAAHPGTMVEEKPFGVALHYRGAPAAEESCRALAEKLAAQAGLSLQHGKMVVELRLAGADKGSALDTFMAEPPMRGTFPVFVGDDLTDEHAFAAAARAGGHGIAVGASRPTAAHYRLPDVAATRAWLEAAADALP